MPPLSMQTGQDGRTCCWMVCRNLLIKFPNLLNRGFRTGDILGITHLSSITNPREIGELLGITHSSAMLESIELIDSPWKIPGSVFTDSREFARMSGFRGFLVVIEGGLAVVSSSWRVSYSKLG